MQFNSSRGTQSDPFSALHSAILSSSSAATASRDAVDLVEERVEVNQRHLIDKILARYSSDFTVFRELIQNSNDAGATHVRIYFATNAGPIHNHAKSESDAPRSPQPTKPKVQAITYQNNGVKFRPQDWARLRKIAEGNPDESKIGMFGVGFYSLFSICEEPLVISGTDCMFFFWKGDTLYTKRGTMQANNHEAEWTTFYLRLRELDDPPNISDFAQFLATSLGFTNTLTKVEVFVDNERVIYVQKRFGDARNLEFDPKQYTLESPERVFTLESVSVRSIQLDVECILPPPQVNPENDNGRTANTIKNVLSSFFFGMSKPSKPEVTEATSPKPIQQNVTVFLRIANGKAQVTASDRLSRDFERTTKKFPPKSVQIQLLWNNWDEYSSSTKSTDSTLLSGLIAFPNQGRVFIGFATHQTTGCCMHLAAHLIPTVERESIDFVDAALSHWNQELLTTCATISRIVYEDEMNYISMLFFPTDDEQDEGSKYFVNRASHALKSFTFKSSTPHPLVSKILQTYFFRCTSKPISIITSRGVVPITNARLPDESVVSFIRHVPLISPSSFDQCHEAYEMFERQQWIQKIDIEDIIEELSKRDLTEDEFRSLIAWWIKYVGRNSRFIVDQQRQRLFSVVKIPNGNGRKLSDMRYWANVRLFGTDISLPRECFPIQWTKSWSSSDASNFFGPQGSELPLPVWLRFILDTERTFAATATSEEKSPLLAEKVLQTLSRAFANLNATDRALVASMLTEIECVPTKLGLMRPEMTYLRSVNMFEDLPTVTAKNLSPEFLRALGVREHVNLQLIFERLEEEWDHVQLVKYLCTVSDKLNEQEWKRIQDATLFPKDTTMPSIDKSEDGTEKIAEAAAPETVQVQKYRARELYFPNDTLKRLDYPTIDWLNAKTRLKPFTEEGKFLVKLGLKIIVPLSDLLNRIASTTEESMRSQLYEYFFEMMPNYKDSYKPHAINIKFLITEKAGFCTPSGCYTDTGCAILGFPLLHSSLLPRASLLGVRENPPGQAIAEEVIRRPPKAKDASAVFAYLASRMHDFREPEWKRLRGARFVPVLAGEDERYQCPRDVYLGDQNGPFAEHFLYVNYGDLANAFLSSCGAKDEPSSTDLAQRVVEKPDIFLKSSGVESYLSLLKKLAHFSDQLLNNRALVERMRQSAWLLAIVASEGDTSSSEIQYELARPEDIVLVDDTVLVKHFKTLSCPNEAVLEEFYNQLGSQWISALVTEAFQPIGRPFTTTASQKLESLIHERTPLLLFDSQKKSRHNKEAEKILNNLKVSTVSAIKIHRTFQPTKQVKVSDTSACLLLTSSDGYVLFISQNEDNVDYFDIGQTLSRVLYGKNNLQQVLLIESILETDLLKLSQRGWPVERIIKKQKPNEKPSKITLKEPATTSSVKTVDKLGSRNGSVQDHRDHESSLQLTETQSETEAEEPVPGSWLQRWSEVLQRSRDSLLNSSEDFKQTQKTQATEINKKKIDTKVTPETTQRLKQRLSDSVQSLRSSTASSLQTQIPTSPVEPPDVAQTRNHLCHIRAEHDLIKSGTAGLITVFIDRSFPDPFSVAQEKEVLLQRFSVLIEKLCSVYKVRPETCNIFIDPEASPNTVTAFNRSGTLFFNARYFEGLHEGKSSLDAYIYWFIICGHELAHQFSHNHDAEFVFYQQSFIASYFPELLRLLELEQVI